jgi:DNA-binding response OmpR family regulator
MARILVIDDEQYIREMLQRHLERRGHEVATAPDGVSGMEAFRSHPADVVIVDILMPGELGTTTMLHLSSEFPETQIIAISGGGELPTEHGLEIARQVGARRAFPKPLNMKEFLQAVDDLANTRTRAVEAILDAYFQAITTRDFVTALGGMSQEADAILIDPVSDNIAVGFNSFRKSLTRNLDYSVRPVEYTMIEVKSLGPVTLFAAKCVVRILGNEEPAGRDIPGRWTGVIEIRGEKLVLVQSHMSVSFSVAVSTAPKEARVQ